MRAASAALIALLNASRVNPDSKLCFADCFTFSLPSGLILTYTNIDTPVTFNGFVFSASGPLVSGLKMHASVGFSVDTQQVTIAARPTDLLSGALFLNALRSGAFDGCIVRRDRVFMATPGGAVVDGMMMFRGRVSTVDMVGRTSATLTVSSDLIILDQDMPRNLYSATCNHTLYDSGCTLARASFGTTGAVGASSTIALINWTGALAAHAQGAIIFSSGVNANVRATVSSAVAGVSLSLIRSLPSTPGVADIFTVYFGCDHTAATCTARFANLANFRGHPFVPPPETAQ